MGKGAIISCLFKHIHISLLVRNHHMNIEKVHWHERMTVLEGAQENQRSWDDGHCSHSSSTNCGWWSRIFYYCEADYLLEEATEDEVMPSQLGAFRSLLQEVVGCIKWSESSLIRGLGYIPWKNHTKVNVYTGLYMYGVTFPVPTYSYIHTCC